jgi:hypothetical protein
MIRLRPVGFGATGSMDEGVVAFGGEGTAGFTRCHRDCIADVPIGGAWKSGARASGRRHAGLETRDTADLEVCGTTTGQSDSFFAGQCQDAPAAKWPTKIRPRILPHFPDGTGDFHHVTIAPRHSVGTGQQGTALYGSSIRGELESLIQH